MLVRSWLTRVQAPSMLALGVLLIVGAMVVSAWLYRERSIAADSQPTPSMDPSGVDVDPSGSRPMASFFANMQSDNSYHDEHSDFEFPTEEILTNPDCEQHVGDGPSSELSLVVLPSDAGASFAAVNADGILYADHLPFIPRWSSIARHEEGWVLSMFEGMQREQPGAPRPDQDEPLRIYRDGEMILDHHKIWAAGVADDGSSYYFIEPVGTGSRLVIHNLEQGTEQTYDLTDTYARNHAGGVSHGVRYSMNFSEVMLDPLYSGIGVHHFFPVKANDRKRRVFPLPESGVIKYADFASSETGYFGYYVQDINNGRARTRLSRQDITWTEHDARLESRWDREGGIVGKISNDGSLLISPSGAMLIDARTGETLFELPLVGSPVPQPRLGDSPGLDSAPELVKTVHGAYYQGDELLVYMDLQTEGPPLATRQVFDVYELEGIHMDSRPLMRMNATEQGPCPPFAARGQLRIDEGRLKFVLGYESA